MENKDTYEKGKRYLVKSYSDVIEIAIEDVSELAYKIRFLNGYISWRLKKDLYADYTFVEELSEPPKTESPIGE
jgi:hypothetical protein